MKFKAFYDETGWVVISDGPSGAQLQGPKKMRFQTKFALVIGILGLAVFGIGILFLIAGALDYAFFTTAPMKFLPRPSRLS